MRHLGNIRKEHIHLLRKAIKRSHFKISVTDPMPPQDGFIGVSTRESPRCDLGPFWREYERVKAKWENGNWLTRLLMSLFG